MFSYACGAVYPPQGDDGVRVTFLSWLHVFRNLVLIRSTQSKSHVFRVCIGAGTPVLVSFVLDLICIIPLDLMHFARVDP